ncbi:hypothetical protein E2562_028081 [Oryza meyeriana var. granulata]|uniref:Uncharacterized protein n=1 Tax=Oryza meyeriana var. granulata TaxID=110450 RepID=A0A6G1C1C0_9ORYZ|nr:hypothetical protein E2562_028081 [Oryza meyeriana var. granulata]
MKQENPEVKKDEDQIQTDLKSEKDQDQIQTALKSEKDQSHVAVKSEKADTEKLIQFMEEHYEEHVANVQSFDDFYHAIVELIEKFCEERGQVQYKIPKKEKLLDVYNKHHTAEGNLRRDEFIKIGKEVIRRDSFTLGKATMDFIMYLFGAPLCALAAKRLLPGLGWLSDDVVIPLATSGSVAYLIKTKQL